MTQKEAVKQIHDRVRQCFTRHKFKTFGDALGWWHKVDSDTQKLEAGEQGMSKFSIDILWLTSNFGPKETVDYKIMGTRKVPKLKPVKIVDEEESIKPCILIPFPPKSVKKKKKKRRKRF